MSLLALRRDVVILACAVSAGIHGALVRGHLDEGIAVGVGFAAATTALACLVVALTLRPASTVALAGAAAVLFGLLGNYLLAVSAGLPVLHPEPEPVDGLALATKAVEAVGLIAAATLLRRPPVAFALSQAKGTVR